MSAALSSANNRSYPSMYVVTYTYDVRITFRRRRPYGTTTFSLIFTKRDLIKIRYYIFSYRMKKWWRHDDG